MELIVEFLKKLQLAELRIVIKVTEACAHKKKLSITSYICTIHFITKLTILFLQSRCVTDNELLKKDHNILARSFFGLRRLYFRSIQDPLVHGYCRKVPIDPRVNGVSEWLF